jgi:nucleotide-binding universal stress UspA family protein
MVEEYTFFRNRMQAVEDFRRIRQQASMQEILARLTGQPSHLLAFDEIRQKFRVGSSSFRGLQEISVNAIVGSVSRYHDFNRKFLPRGSTDEDRWARVKAATLSLTGVPPIEVYKIGEVYFVVDGNHRVSVARQLGASHIQAYVTEFHTKVPLKPEDQPDDLILKAEYAEFLEHTKLDELRPGANLQMTAPGYYWELLTQIEAHRYMLTQEQKREISYREAVESWYDHLYLPMIQIICERGILRDFPNRTETDLYLWIFRHRAELAKKLGWPIDTEAAALDLTSQYSNTPERVIAWVEGKIIDALLPDQLGAGPTPGQWRREWLESRPRDRLFGNILVAISGNEQSWYALDQAILVAQREGSQIFGLTVAGRSQQEAAQQVKEEFNRRCQEAGVLGQMSIAAGNITQNIVERARWADLVVVHLAHPPGRQTLSRLSSGFRMLLHRSPRVVLAVPAPASSLKRTLLAYDGSPKAQEGLYVATYLACCWPMSLVVLTVDRQNGSAEILKRAQQHLEERNITATFLLKPGEVAETILQSAAENESDLIIMGGYGAQPLFEVVLGSSVDEVLRKSRQPMLICR